MRKWLPALSLVILLSGCGANFTTVERRTELPGSGSEGTAIHLDAKQRIVFSKAPGIVCAEPSPDALSAFSSSFGGGVAVPQYGSLAIAQALSESAASIGLRTQSITLMRDALYRICEAAYNGSINPVMVMQLLGRSQDLSLAVLAIEQLTQPVVAQQATLGGSSSSTSSANLLVSQQLLDAARTHETQANDKLAAAKTKRDATAKTETEKTAAWTKLTQQQNPAADPKVIETARQESEQAKQDLARDDQALKDADAAAKDAKQNRETVEKSNGNAQASASANASSSAVLSAPIILRPPPSDASMKAIAEAVSNVVNKVVDKDHRVDACLSFLSARAEQKNATQQQKQGAGKVLSLQMQDEQDKKQQTTEDVCNILLQRALTKMLLE